MRPIGDILNEGLFPGNSAGYAELKELVRNGRVLGFVGAGASAPLFPMWSALLRDLIGAATREGRINNPTEAAELEEQIDESPLDVASALEEYFTRHVFRARLAKIYRQHDNECTEAHRLIVRLNAKGLVTLNYDNGLEVAYSQEKSAAPSTMRAQDIAELVRWLQGETFGPGKLPILHLHGTPSDPEGMVFTGEDYHKFYSSKHPGAFVEQMWRSERLLVIGFGFFDPFLTRVAERTLINLPTDVRHHALIGRRADQPVSALSRRTFVRKYRLEPIFYEVRDGPSGPGTDHSDLQEILKALHDSGAPATGIAGSVGGAGLPTAGSTIVGTSSRHATAVSEFEKHLHYAPDGTVLYVEPRIYRPQGEGADPTNVTHIPVTVTEIVQSEASYIVSARPEYGTTTLCRRLHRDLSIAGETTHFRDANLLPNYKKKLQEEFPESNDGKPAGAVLILDNLDPSRHERLLKELVGLNYFKRFILCSEARETEGLGTLAADLLPLKANLIILSHLDRSDIRSLATALFDTSDHDLVSTVVDKVYGDLLALCIPLTPSNVIMYLTILHREGFQPLNRVQIVEHYIQQLLRRPSDVYSDVFNNRNKIDVVSAFVYALHKRKKTSFTEADWRGFCFSYKASALIAFDDRAVLFELLRARIVIQSNTDMYFKYRLFYSYFLGFYVANRPAVLADFIKEEAYLSAEGVVEVIAGTSTDSSALVTELIEKLERCVGDFNNAYALKN